MRRLMLGLTIAAVLSSACASSATKAEGTSTVLRLGIFPNLTHAPGWAGIGDGIFEETLAPTKVEVHVFNSGSDAGVALTSGSIDATYIGPGPTASLFNESQQHVAVVSGAVSGGASLVVRTGSGITIASDLHGKKIAIPGVGNTQDVALRTWMHQNGLKARDEGGDVSVNAVDNSNLFQLFKSGGIDGAWIPEPYPSYLIEQGLAEPFVDEASLWPDGKFVTTQLVVNTAYLSAQPEVIAKLVEANVKSIQFLNDEPDKAKAIVQQQLLDNGAPSLGQTVIDAAWDRLTFTWDPVVSSQVQDAQNAFKVGALDADPTNIQDVYALTVLNDYLKSIGEKPVGVKP